MNDKIWYIIIDDLCIQL